MCSKCTTKVKEVWVYPGVEKLRIEYSNGTTDLINLGSWKANVEALNEMKRTYEQFTIHDVLTGTSYKTKEN